MSEQEPTTRVTLTRVYEQQLEMKDLLVRIEEKMEASEKLTSDHEKRIRLLEQFKWVLLGIATASGGLGALFTKIINS